PRDDHGHQPLAPVSAVDVLLITPTEDMNAACARLHQAMEDEGHPYAPINRPTVMGWSLDGGTGVYTLVRTSYAGNPQLRDHGRTPSLSTWLRNGHDTLRGLPRHFETVKVAARFMNDEPPEVYTATVLWAVSMPRLIADRGLPTPCDLE